MGPSQFQAAEKKVDEAVSRYNTSLDDLGLDITIDSMQRGTHIQTNLNKLTGNVENILSELEKLTLCINDPFEY